MFFEAAIVDLDGTMVDTLGDFVVALNSMLTELGLPSIDAPTIETKVGKGSEHLIHAVLRHVRNDEPAGATLFDAAWKSYERHYLAINGQHSTVYPGVLEGLEAMRSMDIRIACLTNKPTSFAKPLLAMKQLDSYFDVVLGGDAFERKKPDPLPVVGTCKALGVGMTRTLMVGDSVNDARAARAAGCPIVLVTYGYNHGLPVRGIDADAYVDSMAELDALMKTAA